MHTILIPPRLQWQSDHGYCGETSIQAIGLHYGAWISQGLIRQVAGGELLLGVNETKALDALHFSYEVWDSKRQSRPQFHPFMEWLKAHLLEGKPCVIAIYLKGFPHPGYDHIVPVVGVISVNAESSSFDPQDELIYHNLFSTQPLHRSFHSLGATRQQCDFGMMAGGNIPEQIAFGVAITGLQDFKHISLPLQLTVDSPSEPNWTIYEKPSSMSGHLTASGLEAGHRYILLRYDKISNFPTQGSDKAFLHSRFSSRVDFKSMATTWSYVDPRPIRTDGATFYRCIPAP